MGTGGRSLAAENPEKMSVRIMDTVLAIKM